MSAAPQLSGDRWFAIDGERLNIEDFRGRFLLLDFWTLCCVNCHHVLAELRTIEKKFADVLTVVGVHSPKFEHEKDPESVLQAIVRHDIEHPVLNDPDLTTWQAYSVRAWPTLVLVDPEGQIAASYSGEGHAHAIDALLTEQVEVFESRGTLHRGKSLYQPVEVPVGIFRQPGKIEVIPEHCRPLMGGADLLVSDSGGHRLAAVSHEEPDTIVWSAGVGSRGHQDGSLGSSAFAEPYGVAFLPEETAAAVGFHLVVADTANHLLRGIHLATGSVTTLAGTTRQWMQQDPTEGPGLEVSLSTPWDVALEGSTVVIAMAGDHRLWHYDLLSGHVSVWAGTSNEGLVDGALEHTWFAQPSGLALGADAMWLVDSETSALRRIRGGATDTVVGKGLFDFGHVDGIAPEALLQHPLGVALLPDQSVLIADTYNGAIRRYSPETNQVSTVRRGLFEPSDVAVLDTDDGVAIAVVESSAHKVTVLPLPEATVHRGESLSTARPAIRVRPGALTLEVGFVPPPGQKQDERYGPSTQLIVSSTPAALLVEGAGRGVELTRQLELGEAGSEGVLHVQAKGASCEHGDNAACHIHQQDWGIPVVVDPEGDSIVSLLLSGATTND